MSGTLGRVLLLLAATATLVLVPSACARGDDDGDAQAPTTQTEETETETGPPREPAVPPETALEQFISAVEERSPRSWDLISIETKRSFELTQQHYTEVLLPVLRRDLDSGARVLFSERIDERRALVVVESATRNAPFAGALRIEDDTWKIELFYPEFTPNRPTPGEALPAGRQKILLDVVRRADEGLDVKVWLDGKPVTLEVERVGRFVNTYTTSLRVTRGRHLLIAHAVTDSGLAGAAAWVFSGR